MGDIKQDCVQIVPGVIRLEAGLISLRPGAISTWIILMRNPQAAPLLCHHLYHLVDSFHLRFFFLSYLSLDHSSILFLWLLVAQNYNIMVGLLQNHLTPPGAYEVNWDVLWLWMEHQLPQGKYLWWCFRRFGPECNMGCSRRHLMFRKHLAPRVIFWTCLQSETSLIPRQKHSVHRCSVLAHSEHHKPQKCWQVRW